MNYKGVLDVTFCPCNLRLNYVDLLQELLPKSHIHVRQPCRYMSMWCTLYRHFHSLTLCITVLSYLLVKFRFNFRFPFLHCNYIIAHINAGVK
nr:MAG TPA: hypothetical protein [Caudoviricetes sp.]